MEAVDRYAARRKPQRNFGGNLRKLWLLTGRIHLYIVRLRRPDKCERRVQSREEEADKNGSHDPAKHETLCEKFQDLGKN